MTRTPAPNYVLWGVKKEHGHKVLKMHIAPKIPKWSRDLWAGLGWTVEILPEGEEPVALRLAIHQMCAGTYKPPTP